MSVSLPLKWHGGKGEFNGVLAKWIVSLIPPHSHYVEPYCGGCSVLLHKSPDGVSEIVNDISGELTTFWRVMADEHQFAMFARKVAAIPFSENEFELSLAAHEQWLNGECIQSGVFEVDRAVLFFVLCRQSRQGLMKDFATLSRNRTRGGMNEQVSAWLTAVAGLPDVHARLKRVVVMNRPAIDLIESEDGTKTVFYLDPCYLHETRKTVSDYQFEMTSQDHTVLLDTLGQIRDSKFLLSGYRSTMYDSAANLHGWNRHEYKIANNASSKSTKDVKTECIWTNF